ncbi:hypothetical protein TNCT_615761 [Trichonephila clavata]|uniref:Uncharacterized protein n=1 Tax=Trichonephila clavata TaxID=2740835 RepID=A0A8X6KDK6_TRICU|nr:hypothetical protein TNCT_615761 [Trichonephila clavata]
MIPTCLVTHSVFKDLNLDIISTIKALRTSDTDIKFHDHVSGRRFFPMKEMVLRTSYKACSDMCGDYGKLWWQQSFPPAEMSEFFGNAGKQLDQHPQYFFPAHNSEVVFLSDL